MKRFISYLLIFAMLVGISVPNSGSVNAATKLKLEKKKVVLKVNETVKVKYKSAKKPKASSKDKKIAIVKVAKKIIIKGVKKGKTKITVKAGKTKKIISVSVKAADKIVMPEKVTETISPASLVLPTVNPVVKTELKNVASYADTVNGFSYKSFSSLRKKDENIFVSPFSLYIALAMITNGAEGNTKTELLTALGISDFNDWNSKVKALMNGSADNKVVLNIANAAWIGNHTAISPTIDADFTDNLKTNYLSEVKKNVNFSVPDFVSEINKWAEEKTNGMIKEILKDPLDIDTVLVLANAVYFLGEWSYPFDAIDTYNKYFNGTKGKNMISMMSKYNTNLKYFDDKKFKGAELPYGEGNYVMDVLMSSDSNTTAGSVWETMTAEERLAEFNKFDTAEKTKINLLEMPKFELEASYEDELKNMLKSFGVNDAFNPAASNFSKIGADVYIDKIKQKTKLKVNEKGTEAAAVTVIVAKNASAISPIGDKIDFIVDRPFIFAIKDKLSGMVLFVGEVNNL